MKKQFILLMLSMSFGVHAEIYRWTDSAGTVHFSDTPHSGSQSYEPKSVSSYASDIENSQAKKEGEKKEEKKDTQETPAFEGYEWIRVTNPPAQATIRNAQGSVTIEIAINPKLQPGHKVQLNLDGKVIATSEGSLSFNLQGVPRGTHTVGAEVFDAKGKFLVASTPVTFFMHPPRVDMIPKSPSSDATQ